MSKQTVPITLVSSVSRGLCRSLHEKLTGLGYRDIDLLDCNKFSGVDPSQKRVFIVQLSFSQHSQSSTNITSFFERINHEQVLGIISKSTDQWSKEALGFCNEFLYWPCAESEIELRLERLASSLHINSRVKDDESILDDFLSLNMVGRSPPFLHVLQQIKKISRYDAPVLIEGETGTGKELAARAIHYLSPRNASPFIPVNCGAIPDSLVENELFGHKKGAYTDAINSQEGIVGLANHGTIFLDEVETFSNKGQVVLLRFLEDQLYKPLGSEHSCKADVRIIAASNKELSLLVELGLFRQDLFYRLNIVKIEMPTLSQRTGDIELLTEYFFEKYKTQYNQHDKFLHPDSLQWLRKYGWPGNVRELDNLLHREFLLAEGSTVTLSNSSSIHPNRRKGNMDRRQKRFLKKNMKEAKAEIIRRFEVEYLTRLLNDTSGNVTEAAKKAGKERRSLGKLIKKHGIEKNSRIADSSTIKQYFP